MDRFLLHWRTTTLGWVTLGGLIFAALFKNHPNWAWIPDVTTVLGVIGLWAAKDK